MADAKRRQSDTLPRWGRPRTSVNSGGIQLNDSTDGFFTEDQTYRRKKQKGAVKWQIIPAETEFDGDVEDPSDGTFVPGQWDFGLGELYEEIHYDPGYTQQDRERKVRTLLPLNFA